MTDRNAAMSFWDGLDADLKERWARGETATDIAKAYTAQFRRPFTRNQLCSQLARRCEKRAAAGVAEGATGVQQPKSKPVRVTGPAPSARGKIPAGAMLPLSKPDVAAKFAQAGKEAIAAIEASAPKGGVSMMALEVGMCRKPTGGSGADMRYCGRRTEIRRGRYSSYCGICSTGLTTGTQRVDVQKLQKHLTSGSVRRGYPQ